MMKRIFVFFILTLIWGRSEAQRAVTTLSGQKILLLNNRTWKKVIPNEQQSDSSGLLINDLKTMTLPPSDTLSDQTAKNIGLILSAAQNKEIENFIFLDSLDKEIAVKEVAISKSKISNNNFNINEIKSEIKVLRTKMKDAQKVYQTSSENITLVKNISNMKSKDQQNKIKEFALIYDVKLIQPEIYQNDPVSANQIVSKTNKTIETKTDCKIIRDEKIEKQRHLETEAEFLYSYTPDKLKSYFKEKELMLVSAATQKIGKNIFLKLTIKIISKDAAKNYGMVQKGNMLKISFISGKSIIANSLNDAGSSLENYTGNSIYNVLYPLSKENASLLSKLPLDTIGIMWSSGFETYEIYEVDLLMKQLACIDSI